MKLTEKISEAGIRRKDLIRGSDLDKYTLSKVEHGKVLPTVHDMRHICDKLGCKPLDLYEESEIDLLGCMAAETPCKEPTADHHKRKAKRTFRLDTGVATRLTDDVLKVCGYKTYQEWFDGCVDALLKEYEQKKGEQHG